MCLHKGKREKIRCPQYVKASANSLLPSLFSLVKYLNSVTSPSPLHLRYNEVNLWARTRLTAGKTQHNPHWRLQSFSNLTQKKIEPRDAHPHTNVQQKRKKKRAISGKANVTVSAAWGGGERERPCRVKGVLPGVNMFPGLCTLLHVNYPGKPWAFCLCPLNFNTPLSYTATAQP